jgi:metal-sulfur cluster biosynthetic enzyme
MGRNMSAELANEVKEAVSKVNDPHMGVSIVEMGIVQNIDIDGTTAKIVIKPTNPGCMSVARMAADAKAQAASVDGIDNVQVTVEGHAMADSINEMINKD